MEQNAKLKRNSSAENSRNAFICSVSNYIKERRQFWRLKNLQEEYDCLLGCCTCGLVHIDRRFKDTYCLFHQDDEPVSIYQT
jgi:hypothetical protein